MLLPLSKQQWLSPVLLGLEFIDSKEGSDQHLEVQVPAGSLDISRAQLTTTDWLV
jgi:hypothetical protein